MKHLIESEELIVEVNSIGMELCSIRSKNRNVEYLWQGDSTYWTGQAPVLFPIIGALKNGQFKYQGIQYDMPKHGFVRNSPKPKLIEQGPNFLTMALSWDEESLKIYPFKFNLTMSFILEGKTLNIQHQISNEGGGELFYSIGAHPAFNCPLRKNESYGDYYLEFDQKEQDSTWLIDPSGLIRLDQKPFLEHTKELPLHAQLFDQDALVFKKLKSRRVGP